MRMRKWECVNGSTLKCARPQLFGNFTILNLLEKKKFIHYNK
jgi:hypothetical protein